MADLAEDGGGETVPEVVLAPSRITMPGLQPFPVGKNSLPSSWSDCTLSGDTPFCLVGLRNSSWEFQSILSDFSKVEMTVKKIERIENSDLWEKFAFERKRMEKNTREVNEVYLYHGTTADKDDICMEGLDQRLSRIGFFGRGIYFSNSPQKCSSYTELKQKASMPNICTVYKCRVLLGTMKVYPDGQDAKKLKREPMIENPEPGGNTYYDSVKGHIRDSDEFVIYKNDRVLPEYVISCFLPPSTAQDSAADEKADGVKGHQVDEVKGHRGLAPGPVLEYKKEEEISAEVSEELKREGEERDEVSQELKELEEISTELRLMDTPSGIQNQSDALYKLPHSRNSSRAGDLTNSNKFRVSATGQPKGTSQPRSLNEVSGRTANSISSESLPSVMEVREKVWKDRLVDREPDSGPSRAGNPRVRRGTPGQQGSRQAAANSKPKVVRRVKAKPAAEGGMQLNSLIKEFMEVTACEDWRCAKGYIIRANMDVNQAIIHYLNS